jgi:hypothetical protein
MAGKCWSIKLAHGAARYPADVESTREPSETYKALLADPRARVKHAESSRALLLPKRSLQRVKRELEGNR